MRREINYEENDICLMAWLKYNSDSTDLDENELGFISYNIDRLERMGIILPFFKKYGRLLILPKRITERCYIEYKTNPRKQVFLHYRLLKSNNGREYDTERMTNVFMGIHVKEFVLFYNEELEYFITEELKDEVSTSERLRIGYEEEGQEDNSKYSRINRMLKALEAGDDSALLNLMMDYIETEYIMNEISNPLS